MMNKENFIKNKSLKAVTTFGIGGPAKYFIEASSKETLANILQFCLQENLPYFILGKGSNCLFSDQGFNGVIIHNKIEFCHEVSPGKFYTGAGFSFSLLGTQTARKGWAGLEFASGIPGSVGGAVYMNAGANGSETSDALESVDYLDERGNEKRFLRSDLQFSYRKSPFQKMRGAIIGATFNLQASTTARRMQMEIIRYRSSTQPYGEKSAGCVFCNTLQGPAGKLIEECGLKGFSIGSAIVSDKHANFIVNNHFATAQEVLELIDHIKKKIKEKKGIDLETEIRVIPYEMP